MLIKIFVFGRKYADASRQSYFKSTENLHASEMKEHKTKCLMEGAQECNRNQGSSGQNFKPASLCNFLK